MILRIISNLGTRSEKLWNNKSIKQSSGNVLSFNIHFSMKAKVEQGYKWGRILWPDALSAGNPYSFSNKGLFSSFLFYKSLKVQHD